MHGMHAADLTRIDLVVAGWLISLGRPSASEERTKPLPWQPRQDRRHGRTDRTVPLVIGELDSNARSSSRAAAVVLLPRPGAQHNIAI